ncbi:DNA polymerase III subunit alpha [soil metagenome]
MAKEFIHLHNHSHYSLLDAISTIDGLVDAAVENKMRAVALTDHGVMYGVMDFYKKAKSKGVKPIIGCEVYVAQSGNRFDKSVKRVRKATVNSSSDEEAPANDSVDGLASTNINYAHLILLAKNEKGYRNLIKLCSLGHTEGYYYKPRIDLDILNQYREGIIASTACLGGVISCYINRGDMDMARKMTGTYKDIFGDDLYLEIQDHLTIEGEKKVMREMPKLAKEFGVKLIATNDVHYVKKEHAAAHNIYLHLSAKQNKIDDVTDLTDSRYFRYGTDQIYFKSSKEMCDIFQDYPEAITSTLEVAEKCELELDTQTNFMPKFSVPANEKNEILNFDDYLKKIAHEGIKNRIENPTDEYLVRLDYELEVIKKMDFSGYFLIVADFISNARSKDILVGPGRGSCAGSLVCWCVGITEVDPMKYGLLFERFLNPERVSMPDIDIDFQDDRRDEVIQYAKEKYGDTAVAQIVTFNKLAPRGVLKDVGRVLKFPYAEINELTKHIPVLFGKVKKLSECIVEVDDFKKYFNTGLPAQKDSKKKMLEYAMVLENLNKNASIHASGIVIAPSEVTNYVPLSKASADKANKNPDKKDEDVFCTQYDMNQLEDAGMIKIDFLGLKELKVLSRALKLVNDKYDIGLTVEKIPLDDKKTYELFSAGSTVGIFQFSKGKMREYLAKLKPENINDLAAMNALYRPGPMKLIPDFIDRRFKRKPITYLDPVLEKSLKETYGIIVYQEQVMQIARDFAGFSMAEADNMRKAMGKKIKEKMQQIKLKFIKGAEALGHDKRISEELFGLIMDFADYGFNKSHGVAYSILAFYTAYLKTHYPLEYLSVSMACRKDDESELQELVNECRKMNIHLVQPDINLSCPDFIIKYNNTDQEYIGEIIYGLSAIKGVGTKAAQNIVDEREKNGKFKSIIDFLSRVDLRLVNKKAVENMIYSGVFDSLEKNRKMLIINYDSALIFVDRHKENGESSGQSALFDTPKSKHEIYKMRDVPFFTDAEKFQNEKAALGFYLTGHPLEKFEKEISTFVTMSFGDDVNQIDFTRIGMVKMAGVISGLEIKISKRGTRFAVFKLIDLTGNGECIAFSKLFEEKNSLFKNEQLVFVTGRAEENGDKIKLTLEDIMPVESMQQRLACNLTMKILEKEFTQQELQEKLSNIKKLVENSHGNCNVYFHIINNGHSKILKSKSYRVNPDSDFISNLKLLLGENNLSIN